MGLAGVDAGVRSIDGSTTSTSSVIGKDSAQFAAGS